MQQGNLVEGGRQKHKKKNHKKASQRKQVNEIKNIKDVDGHWFYGEENVEKVLVNYFVELFSTYNPREIESTCEVVQRKLSDEHKKWCAKSFSTEEVKEAVFQMHPLKALVRMIFRPYSIRNNGPLWEGMSLCWCWKF